MEALSTSLQMYLETIYMLDQSNDAVRVKDIARSLSVKAPSVHEALHHLDRSGYIILNHYKPVRLTSRGKDAARKLFGRHKILSCFFSEVLGVSGSTAETDACAVEHCISDETFNKLIKYMDKVKQ